MGIAEATLSGYATAHSKACIPPIDPPEMVSIREIPRCSISSFCKRTMSETVTEGNVMAQGQPVSGLIDPGPVVPRQPPSTFEQITKYWSVSKALPGPIIFDHHPPSPAACASPENACSTRIALDRSAFKAP